MILYAEFANNNSVYCLRMSIKIWSAGQNFGVGKAPKFRVNFQNFELKLLKTKRLLKIFERAQPPNTENF